MNIAKFVVLAVSSISLPSLTSCCKLVTTSWGAKVEVCPDDCKPIVKYSGHSFDLAEFSTPISGNAVTIKGVKWDTKTLQTAATISQAMDLQRVQQCQMINSGLSTLTYEHYYEERKKMLANQEKLNQLSYLVAMNNPSAVEKWIASYSTPTSKGKSVSGSERTFAPEKPLINLSKLKS